MATYLSPGVYVEEIPSGSAPIAGVGTSVAGFIGVIETGETENTAEVKGKAEDIAEVKGNVENAPEVEEDAGDTAEIKGNTGDTAKEENQPASIAANTPKGASGKTQQRSAATAKASDSNIVKAVTTTKDTDTVAVKKAEQLSKVSSSDSDSITHYSFNPIDLGRIGTADGAKTKFELNRVLPKGADINVKLDGVSVNEVTLENQEQKLVLVFTQAPTLASPGKGEITAEYTLKSVAAGEVKLCTNFSEFKESFGDFLLNNPGQNNLAHAVYGFFRNGGTRCYVTWVANKNEVTSTLEEKFEAIDEIAIVAAPGVEDKGSLDAIADHCKKMGDRFAILDGPSDKTTELKPGGSTLPSVTDYAALYYPWIQVYDPASKANKTIPPSGHIAGIYARVDTQRGVHKAPANETILGAVGLEYNLSKAKQDGLNPQGVNCIRSLNGSIRVWGARTWGGDANGEFKYISTRRLFNYLRESIDEGTQWTVFEPNSPELWAAIRRNVTAFLTTVWRSGALFGNTPEQAFYVKCDEETNPPDLREQGQVVTEIGVAVVKPAEFVIFRLSQWTGGQG